MKLLILGTPATKQSARFRVAKSAMGKSFVMSYQSKQVKETERNIAYDVKQQLPEGFIPYEGALSVKVLFVFPPLKTFNKAKMKVLEEGGVIYKPQKPDLTDNLMKGLFDAMSGIVFRDDAQICKVESEKRFGLQPRIEVEFEEL